MMRFQISITIFIVINHDPLPCFHLPAAAFAFCKPNAEQFGRLRVNKFNDNRAGGQGASKQAK